MNYGHLFTIMEWFSAWRSRSNPWNVDGKPWLSNLGHPPPAETPCFELTPPSPTRKNIRVSKVDVFNFCTGFRWTAVLESVQRNPLTNAVTLQSIPLFWRFLRSEFRCNALHSTIQYLKHSNLAVDSAKHCRGFHWTLQWTPLLAVVDSTAVL